MATYRVASTLIHARIMVLGGAVVFSLLGRHSLKTYVRVQESSRSAVRVRAWAETLLDRI